MAERLPDLARLRELFRDYNISAVSRATGLSYNAISRFMAGTTSPSYDTVKRLIEYLAGQGEAIDNG